MGDDGTVSDRDVRRAAPLRGSALSRPARSPCRTSTLWNSEREDCDRVGRAVVDVAFPAWPATAVRRVPFQTHPNPAPSLREGAGGACGRGGGTRFPATRRRARL
jgi:hypothetical protein